MIPETFIQELLNRIDIVDVVDKSVPLKKSGANYSACCPFHNEKTPSFTVSPSKQFYHCFGCGAHGSAIGFLMEYQGLGFVEAVSELAQSVGLSVPQQTRSDDGAAAPKATPGMLEALQQAAGYYKSMLKQSTRAIDYLKARGLSGQVAARFQIGYAPPGWQNLKTVFAEYDADALQLSGLVQEGDQGRRYDRFRDRIMFPIHDQKGRIIGFGGRVLNPDDTPKYYNSPETPLFQKGHELYGLFMARRAIRAAGRALVVEGYMDVVALAQYGIEYAVATLGTATTPQHVIKLMRQTSEIVFCFDGDAAGRNAAWRAAMNALPALRDELRLRFLFLPAEHDPDSFVRAFGREALETAIEAAQPLSEYLIQHLSADNPLSSQEDRVRFLNEAEPALKQIQAPRLALLLRKQIAALTGVTADEMRTLIHMPELQRPSPQAPPRRSRTTISLRRRFALLLLLQASAARAEDLQWIDNRDDEDALLKAVIETALGAPGANPAALLYQLEQRLDPRQQAVLERELPLLDETLDYALELEGARKQLQTRYRQRSQRRLLEQLKEKSLKQLTEEERALLRSLNTR